MTDKLQAMWKDPSEQEDRGRSPARAEEHDEIAGVQAKPARAQITLRVGHMVDRY